MDRLKLAAFGERLKIGSAEMGRKVSDKMKEILQGQSQEAKMVDEATSEKLEEPNWGLNLRICGFLNSEQFNVSEVVKAIKKKVCSKNPSTQKLSLDLLETCATNCDKVFSGIASEKLLDDMLRMIDNLETHHPNRRTAMQLIEAWGKCDDLAYLPVFKQAYMALKKKTIERPLLNDDNFGFDPLENERTMVIPEAYPQTDIDRQDSVSPFFIYQDESLSIEEQKEVLVVARSNVEILTSILDSRSKQNPVDVELTSSIVEKCREMQPVIQRIIEGVVADEALLFEALDLHHLLQKVLSDSESAIDPPASYTDQCRAPDESSASTANIGDVPKNTNHGGRGGEALIDGGREETGKEELRG